MIPKKPFKFLLFVSGPYKAWGIFAFVAVTFAQILATASPYIFGKIIDSVNSGNFDLNTTKFWLIATVVVLAFMYAAWRASGLLGMQWITKINAHAYKILFDYLSQHSHSYFSNRFAGALSNKVSNAADGAERLAENTLWHYYQTILSITLTGILIFYAHAYVGALYVGLVLILVVVNYLLVRHRRKYIVAYAKESSTLRGQAVDVTTNITAVRHFAQRLFETKFLEKQINKRKAADLKQWKLGEYSLIINNIIIVFVVSGMFLLLFHLLETGAITLGIFVMVLTLIFNLTGTLTFIGNMMNGFIRVYGEMQEGLSEVLLPHEVVDMVNAKKLNISQGKISFEKVNFAYEKEPVFLDLSFSIAPGEKVGIVGSSGAGKTTLINLLLRQHDIDGGKICIDDQDIHRVTQDSLRESIAVVPQEPLLFHRTIRENIQYGNQQASFEEVCKVAKIAEAETFIKNTTDGYETYVGERGVKLSGGQKQRIAIARALLKEAKILVLDEATSALDSESEAAIQRAFHTLMEGKTVLAIAHRLSTLREMDRILVFDGGKIVEDGSHEELVEKGGVYASLWEHQAGGFLKED